MDLKKGSRIPQPSRRGTGRMLKTNSRQLAETPIESIIIIYDAKGKDINIGNSIIILTSRAHIIAKPRFARGPAADMAERFFLSIQKSQTGTAPQDMPHTNSHMRAIQPMTLSGFKHMKPLRYAVSSPHKCAIYA